MVSLRRMGMLSASRGCLVFLTRLCSKRSSSNQASRGRREGGNRREPSPDACAKERRSRSFRLSEIPHVSQPPGIRQHLAPPPRMLPVVRSAGSQDGPGAHVGELYQVISGRVGEAEFLNLPGLGLLAQVGRQRLAECGAAAAVQFDARALEQPVIMLQQLPEEVVVEDVRLRAERFPVDQCRCRESCPCPCAIAGARWHPASSRVR